MEIFLSEQVPFLIYSLFFTCGCRWCVVILRLRLTWTADTGTRDKRDEEVPLIGVTVGPREMSSESLMVPLGGSKTPPMGA